MTDKEKIKQEIERRIEDHQSRLRKLANSEYFGRWQENEELLKFIDSLPEEPYKPNYCHHEVDLSDCSEEYRKAYYDGWNNCNIQHDLLKNEQFDYHNATIITKDFAGKHAEEPASEDLEKEIEKKWTNCATWVPSAGGESSLLEESGHYELNLSKSDFKDIANHFAEWSRKQIVKDAINGIMDCDDDNEWIEITDKLIVTPSKAGKKVKFIVVKEE